MKTLEDLTGQCCVSVPIIHPIQEVRIANEMLLGLHMFAEYNQTFWCTAGILCVIYLHVVGFAVLQNYIFFTSMLLVLLCVKTDCSF